MRTFYCGLYIILNCHNVVYKFPSCKFSIHIDFIVAEIFIWIDDKSN